MKIFKQLSLLLFLVLSGCVSTTTRPLVPVDTSWYSTPSEGNSGVYFFQWKTGILLSYSDVKFVVDGKSQGKINTGEWVYFEVPAGVHELVFMGGMSPMKGDYDFVEGQNNFFKGGIVSLKDSVLPVYDEASIREAIENIESGRYEHGDID